MDTITIENVCRMCLVELKQVSEPLSNWIDDVLLIFGLEVFLDDGLPQQICPDCSHTLMIVTKLRNTVYETDMILKTYHKTKIEPDLENNEFMNFTSNNIKIEFNVNNIKRSQESLDVIFNYPKLNDAAIPMNNRSIIKSEMRVVLKKLPDYISSTSLIYCSICLLAFADSERFNIHLDMNIHDTNICSFCHITYENVVQFWKHINLVHIDDILKKTEDNKRNEEKEERRKKKAEYRHNWYVNMSEEQSMKKSEYDRTRHANMTEEQRKKESEYMRKRCVNMTDEQRKIRSEYNRNRQVKISEEKRKKKTEYKRKQRANMTEEQRKKELEDRKKRYANMTEEQRRKNAENRRRNFANISEEKKKKRAEYKRMWQCRKKAKGQRKEQKLNADESMIT